jgi:glycosyltransferase involved in cell wall biosynthesis
MGLLGGLSGRLCGVPKIIFTAHGLASNEDRAFLSRKFFLFLHWLTIALSHTTIAVSRKTKSDLDKLPFISQKIFVVYNGIEKINFEPKFAAQKYICDLAKTEPSPLMIGTISELHRNKGLDFLISACKSLPDGVSVYILGDGEEKEKLSGMVEELGLQKKIHMLGRVEDASKYLKVFDIFTLTSRTEALPYAVLEAGAAGCAVLASRVGGIPEIVENGESGILVTPGDIPEIERALNFLIQKKEKRQGFGEHLREIVEREFSASEMVSRTEKFYTSSL